MISDLKSNLTSLVGELIRPEPLVPKILTGAVLGYLIETQVFPSTDLKTWRKSMTIWFMVKGLDIF